MHKRRIPDTDLDVSALCYGGAAFGTGVQGAELDTLLNAFRDAGGNFFDTAHCYSFWMPGGDGASERSLADYFRRNGGADEAVIATKGGHPGRPNYRRVDQFLSAGRIAADIDDSLARLNVEAIDLYWLHRDDPRLPVGQIVEMLNQEVRRGRIRYFGGSNWTSSRLDEANNYAAEHGLQGFVASQPEWSLAERNFPASYDTSLLYLTAEEQDWYEAHEFPVIPYSSTARGYFATEGSANSDDYDNPVSRARLIRAQRLARELKCSVNQVALSFLLSQDFPVYPIIGTGRLEHLKDALGATEVRLSSEQTTWLRDG